MKKFFTTLTFMCLVALGVSAWQLPSGNEGETTEGTEETSAPKITLADELTIHLSDEGATIPVTIETGGKEFTAITWYYQDEEGKTDRTVVSRISATKTDPAGKLTFTGKTGVVYLSVRIRVDGEYYYSNRCKLTVAAPEKPITALSFANAEMTAEIRSKVENPLTITPADATYTGITYTSSDEKVASVSSSGVVTTTTTTGTAVITAQSTSEPSVSASYTLTVQNSKPVTAINVVGGNTIEMETGDIHPLPELTFEPEDANYTAVSRTIEDPEIATIYQNNIVSHKVGETNLIITASDGSGVTATVKIIVKEKDRTPYDGYQDGTIILNEEWFGHTNGGMNFLTADDEMMYNVYERENPGMAFGATSCYGMIYGGKMYVMSKQEADGGDTGTQPGGRLVVMDAKTLKRIAGFDEIGGGDGRACVGVNPHKVYLSTTGGVVVFDVDKMEVGGVIEGTQGASLYSGQTGDMLKTGKYVFALQQSKGVHVIDAEADKLVQTIEDKDIQGIAQTPDGDVWLGTTDSLKCIDPVTLEIKEKMELPEGANISCSWGAWRPTPFCASRTKNVLYWNGGSNIMNNGSAFYRYETGTDISTLKPFFTLDNLKAEDETKEQISYGTIGYDDRDDELIVMTTQSGWGANYEHNWIHLVNGTTGELKKTIKLRQYYWFQAMPIFPDKYAPEFVDVENSVGLEEGGKAYTIDLEGKVTDKDNLVYNITTTLADAGDAKVAEAEFDGAVLTVKPVAEGKTTVVLTAESNGVVTEYPIEISVTTLTGITNVGAEGDAATEVARYTLDGKRLDRPQPGVNIVRMSDGTVRKVIVR